ncbi:STAS domain-containing protein [Streptosporangium amethystogenes]|uniref:STAS domain-containing protein n=1 Tax=Streptosporangium amethystogenes TaxID=2002 RepID=UPI0037B92747
MTQFSVNITFCSCPPGCAVLTLEGELDLVSAPLLAQVLGTALERGYRRLVVDAAKLRFCDSAGVQALAEGHRRAAVAGGGLVLAYVHGVLLRVLEINRQAGAFPLDVELFMTTQW